MRLKKFPFEVILERYKINGRHDLPWRKSQTPYHVWISEIFLQQTQVSRVVDYFEKVTKKFPDIQTLTHTSYEEFFPYYEGLGYYSRARNMLKTAQIIHGDYADNFPRNYNQLMSLPGIGPYTAQAILAFGFGENILAFDTNIEKIFARYYFGSRFIKLSKEFKSEIQKQFEETCIFGREINAALMDFASIIDINEKEKIDYENYPLIKSKFYKEKGKNEHKPLNIKNIHNKNEVQIIVFLHKDHKEYYSSNPDKFEAFILGKHNGDHRHFIKDFFLTKHSLSLSVRPPYKKTKNAFFYHAQIQKGKHDFGVFEKSEKNGYENILEKK